DVAQVRRLLGGRRGQRGGGHDEEGETDTGRRLDDGDPQVAGLEEPSAGGGGGRQGVEGRGHEPAQAGVGGDGAAELAYRSVLILLAPGPLGEYGQGHADRE